MKNKKREGVEEGKSTFASPTPPGGNPRRMNHHESFSENLANLRVFYYIELHPNSRNGNPIFGPDGAIDCWR